MSNYQYKSKSSKPFVRLRRELGFQLFCHRHKHKITVAEVCSNVHITPRNLDKLELAVGNVNSPALRRLLDFYDLDINVNLAD